MGQPGALPGRNIPPQLAGAMGAQAPVGLQNPGGQGVGMRNRGPASPQIEQQQAQALQCLLCSKEALHRG